MPLDAGYVLLAQGAAGRHERVEALFEAVPLEVNALRAQQK
jgi:hypothetical protein